MTSNIQTYNKKLITAYQHGNLTDRKVMRKVRSLIRSGFLSNPRKVTRSRKDQNFNKKLLRAIGNGLRNVMTVYNIPFKYNIINPLAYAMDTLDLIKVVKYEIARPLSRVMKNDFEEAPMEYYNIFTKETYGFLQKIKPNKRGFSIAQSILNLKRCAPIMPKSFEEVAIDKHKKNMTREGIKLNAREMEEFGRLLDVVFMPLQDEYERFHPVAANPSATNEFSRKDGGAREFFKVPNSVIEERKNKQLDTLDEIIKRKDEILRDMEEEEKNLRILEIDDKEVEWTFYSLPDMWVYNENEVLDVHTKRMWYNVEMKRKMAKLTLAEKIKEEYDTIRDYDHVSDYQKEKLLELIEKIDYDNPPAKVAVIQDPMKCRIITKEQTLHHALRPIHKTLLRAMSRYKIFSITKSGLNPYSFTTCFRNLKKGEFFASVDYEAATDNVAPEFYEIFHDFLLSKFTDPITSEIIKENKKRREIIYPDGSRILQKNGQLMGSYMSSIVLNLYNLYGVMVGKFGHKVFNNLKSVYNKIIQLGREVKFCGDDLVAIFNKYDYKKFVQYLPKIGMTLSKGKSYTNPSYFIFCSKGYVFEGKFNGTIGTNKYKNHAKCMINKFAMVQFFEKTELEAIQVPNSEGELKSRSLEQLLQMLEVAMKGKRTHFNKQKYYSMFMKAIGPNLKKSCRALFEPRSKNGFGLKIKYFNFINKDLIKKKHLKSDSLIMEILADQGYKYIPPREKNMSYDFVRYNNTDIGPRYDSQFDIDVERSTQYDIFSMEKVDLREVGINDRKFMKKYKRILEQKLEDVKEIKKQRFLDAAYRYERLEENSTVRPILGNLTVRYREEYLTSTTLTSLIQAKVDRQTF